MVGLWLCAILALPTSVVWADSLYPGYSDHSNLGPGKVAIYELRVDTERTYRCEIVCSSWDDRLSVTLRINDFVPVFGGTRSGRETSFDIDTDWTRKNYVLEIHNDTDHDVAYRIRLWEVASIKRLNSAVANNDYYEVKRILAENRELLNESDTNGDRPLDVALINNNYEMADLLISRGADLQPALCNAATRGNLKAAGFLLDHGARVNYQDRSGRTPLHFAARGGKIDIVQLLLDRGASVNAEDKDKWTALQVAAKEGYLEVVQLLISRGAEVNVANKDKWTPLHEATATGHKEVVEELLSAGANVNSANNKGMSPLQMAAQLGQREIAELLIKNRADVNVRNNDGWTPLHEAASKGYLEIAQLLINNGADINAANNRGQTPLYLATHSGKTQVADFLRQQGGR